MNNFLFLKLPLFCCYSQASQSAVKTSIYYALRIDRYSPWSKHSQILTTTSPITMSNNTELHDREYIVPLFVLNAFFALTAVVLNSVTIHAIRKTPSALLPKNLRALLLNLAFSDLRVGLVVQPFYVIQLTFSFESQERDIISLLSLIHI